MKERPILFSGSMVRALLAGTKTQTRRALKRQPEPPRAIYSSRGADTKITPSLVRCENGMGVAWRFEMSKIASDKHSTLAVSSIDHEPVHIVCPYGNPGDRLWVRETHAIVPRTAYAHSDGVQQTERPNDDHDAAIYRAGWERSTGGLRWLPSIHMPRWVSRILLEVTDVRVERLQDISEADCIAEGMSPRRADDEDARHMYSPRWAYEMLWNQINGLNAWDANPWVWAVSFKRVPPLAPGEQGRAS